MKKPHVLNRSMFNRGGTSAYGKGITSNLVSDEQRQRFNYGGRVRLAHGTPWDDMDYGGTDFYGPITPSLPSIPYGYSGIGSGRGAGDYIVEEEEETTPIYPDYGRGTDREELEKEHSVREHIKKTKEKIEERERVALGEQEDPIIASLVDKDEKIDTGITPPLPTDPESDVINWKEFAEGLYDKKKTLGKGLLEGAGAVLAASQLPKKEAAVVLGKGLGDFGKTISARREKMEDIAATGKMYETIYKTRETEKGKQARQTAEELATIKRTPSTPKETYDASLALVLSKDSTPSDGDIAAAFWNATRVNPIILKEGKDKDDLRANEAAIANADEEDIFLLNKGWHMKKGGKLVPISEEIALKLKG